MEKGEKRALPLKKQNRARDDIGEEGFLFPYQSKMMHHQNRAGTAGFSLGLVLRCDRTCGSAQRGCLQVNEEVEALIHCALRQDGG